MNRQSSSAGFTRNELLVALIVSFVVIIVLRSAVMANSGRPEIQEAASRGKSIHTMLTVWAGDHHGDFPVADQFSNEAFRALFKAQLVDDEKAFSIANDPWHRTSVDGKGPDNVIGAAPDFAQAVARGECAWAYVSGLNRKSMGTLPLLANAFSESLGAYSPNYTKKGGVFDGKMAVWVSIDGSAKVTDLSSDYRVMQKKGARSVDVFGFDWGTNTDNLKNPEG